LNPDTFGKCKGLLKLTPEEKEEKLIKKTRIRTNKKLRRKEYFTKAIDKINKDIGTL
jgi:hypothetical protein